MLKNGIKDSSVGTNERCQQAEVLVLDDIGAEQFSSWIGMMFCRHPQHRMIEETTYSLRLTIVLRI